MYTSLNRPTNPVQDVMWYERTTQTRKEVQQIYYEYINEQQEKNDNVTKKSQSHIRMYEVFQGY